MSVPCTMIADTTQLQIAGPADRWSRAVHPRQDAPPRRPCLPVPALAAAELADPSS